MSKIKEDGICPAGYFWNGSKCVPDLTPPPQTDDEDDKDVETK